MDKNVTKPLSFDLIRIDANTQNRIAIHEDTVEDYADVIRNTKPGEWPFPPLDVFHDGTEYFMASGFHRMLGAKRGGRESAPCVIHSGTVQDARIFGMTANDSNGLRMSRADKRACVEWLLDNGGKMLQKEIAEKAGVSIRLVKTIVDDRKPKLVPQQPPPVATEVQIALSQPEVGEVDTSTFVEKPEKSQSVTSKPPKKNSRADWYKEWNSAIGPLVRLVDKIANALGEQGESQKVVQDHLNVATEEMQEWLGVNK